MNSDEEQHIASLRHDEYRYQQFDDSQFMMNHHHHHHHHSNNNNTNNNTSSSSPKNSLTPQQLRQYELSAMIHSDSLISTASPYYITPPEVPIELNDPTKIRGNSLSPSLGGTTLQQPLFQNQQYYSRFLDSRFLGFFCVILTEITVIIVHFGINNDDGDHDDADTIPQFPNIFVAVLWFNLLFALAELIAIILICVFFPLFSQRPNNPKKKIMFPSLTSRRFNRLCIAILACRLLLLLTFFLIYASANLFISKFYSHWNWLPLGSILLYITVGAYNLFNSIRGYRYSQHATSSAIQMIDAANNNNTNNNLVLTVLDEELAPGDQSQYKQPNEWIDVMHAFVINDQALTGSQTIY